MINSELMEATLPTPAASTEIAARLVDSVAGVLQGKRSAVELAVTCILGRGHLLLEDVPGVGKTSLARALACSLGLTFRRIQFTSDLMPADLLGGSVYDAQTASFSFRKGPVFTHVLLADEINRTSPKTQSALLEAMGERRVSLDGVTHTLEDPFFVVATQNPAEFFGTYPLPESQLDRFLMRVRLGYPPPEVERGLIARRRAGDPLDQLRAVVNRAELLAAQQAVDRVRVTEELVQYLHALILATRNTPMLDMGASTRAALALDRCVRAFAIVQGRSYATPDDVKTLAVPVLAHRVRPSGSRDGVDARVDAERIVVDQLTSLSVPV
ncbi:MAG: MoxR family ATPase [Proteobacteria bacterium]|nr:MoxR family ATPase [Pseudomonadota bacterium]